MGLMPVRLCPRCRANRHVTSFVAESEWCKVCREEMASQPPTQTSSSAELLSKLVQGQRASNPALADKQARLIESLRAQVGSDEKVLDKLAGIVGLSLPGSATDVEDDAAIREDDEDTSELDEDDACPFCGSHDACQHLLAYMDMTYREIAGGYCMDRMDQFVSVIRTAFLTALNGTDGIRTSWTDSTVEALWTEAREGLEPGDTDLNLGESAALNLFIDVLELEGGLDGIHFAFPDGGPGMSCVYLIFHTEDPAAAFQQALDSVQARLTTTIR